MNLKYHIHKKRNGKREKYSNTKKMGKAITSHFKWIQDREQPTNSSTV